MSHYKGQPDLKTFDDRDLTYDEFVPINLKEFFRYAVIRVRHDHDAEDLVQDALLVAWLKWDTFNRDSTRKTWVISILRFCIATLFRRRKQSVPTVSATNEVVEGVASNHFDVRPDNLAESNELCEYIRSLVGDFPKALNETCTLCWFDGLTPSEAVIELSKTKSATLKNLERGRKRLLKLCAEEGYSLPHQWADAT